MINGILKMSKNFNNLKKKFHKSLANNVRQIIIQNKEIYSFNILYNLWFFIKF